MAKEIKTTVGAFGRTVIWLGVIGAVALVAMFAIHTAKKFIPDAQMAVIATNGECLASVPKDRTAITLRVRTLDKSNATSMKIASTKMSEITAFLKTLDVELQTTDFNSYERQEWSQAEQRSISLGYETSIAVEASASSMDVIETILEKFAGDENVYTENLRMFTSAKTIKPAQEKCLGDAVKNARIRAESIAAADGKTVGKLVSASYGNVASSPIIPANFMRMEKSVVAMDTGYAGGGLVAKDTEISVAVSAVFEID